MQRYSFFIRSQNKFREKKTQKTGQSVKVRITDVGVRGQFDRKEVKQIKLEEL